MGELNVRPMSMPTPLLYAITIALVQSVPMPSLSSESVLVVGATGRTGRILYNQLAQSQDFNVRGTYYRNITNAREVLHCGACTQAEGIFQVDVTDPLSLTAAFTGVKRVAIVAGSFPSAYPNGSTYYHPGASPIDVDYHGCNNQVKAAVAAGVEHILLVSSTGTTQPDGYLDQMGSPGKQGWVLFYKLAAEAFLESSGLKFTIVKPTGLVDSEAGQALLLVGHEDSITNPNTMNVSRGDVANVLFQAIKDPANSTNTRFDLSSDLSRQATNDWQALFASAKQL